MANFTPQEIEEMLQEFFSTVGKRQYVGARYVPIFGRRGSDTCEWDNSDAYEPLTIVIYQGNSYTSKQYVPKDIDITDTNYWVQTGNWNAQIEQYRQEVLGFQSQIDDLKDYVNSDFVPFPTEGHSKYGSLGQVLATLADGNTEWQNPVVPSDEQAEEVITAWLDAHPEATTTVEDNSLTTAKYQAGSVTPEKTSNTVMGYRGTIKANTDANTIVDGGWYAISTAARDTITNLPSDFNTGTGLLIVYRGGHGGINISTQLLYVSSSTTSRIYARLVNNSTLQPISGYNWKTIQLEITDTIIDDSYKVPNSSAIYNVLFNGTIPSYRGGLSENDDLNEIDVAGSYGISVSVRDSILNKPESFISGTGMLLVIVGGHSGHNIITQILIIETSNKRRVYMRLISSKTHAVVSNYNWCMIAGEVTDTITDTSFKLPSSKAVYDAINGIHTFAGKNVVAFGDSRTWYDGKTYNENCKSEWAGETCVGYQQTVQRLIGSNAINNQGVSGNTTAQIATRIMAFDFTNYDAIIFAGGVNDFVKASQVTIGSISPIGSTFDTTTVYGSLQAAVEYMQTNYPSLKIYILVPAIAWVHGDVFPYSTAQARKDVAELYNIPYLDLYKKAGITQINKSYFYCDDPSLTNDWYLHFNDYGNAWLGSMIGKFMNSN